MSMRDRKEVIGVIGGLGNEAMADLGSKMIDVPGSEGRSYIMYGNSRLAYKPDEVGQTWLPTDRPELRKVATAEHTARVMRFLGCGVVGLACNSAHDLFRRVMAGVPVDFVDMIDEAARSMRDVRGKVLVLGVTSLVESGLYQNTLEKYGVQAVRASVENQHKVMSAIYDTEFGIKTAKISSEAQALLCEVLQDEYEKQGCRYVVLGCTELPLALTAAGCAQFRQDGRIPQDLEVVDASAVLAAALINASAENLNAENGVSLERSGSVDWFPPAAFAVETLEEFVSVQSRIICMTSDYLEKRGKSLQGSYMHLPTLFAVGSVPGFAEKAGLLTSNILDAHGDWESRLPDILRAHFNLAG